MPLKVLPATVHSTMKSVQAAVVVLSSLFMSLLMLAEARLVASCCLAEVHVPLLNLTKSGRDTRGLTDQAARAAVWPLKDCTWPDLLALKI